MGETTVKNSFLTESCSTSTSCVFKKTNKHQLGRQRDAHGNN